MGSAEHSTTHVTMIHPWAAEVRHIPTPMTRGLFSATPTPASGAPSTVAQTKTRVMTRWLMARGLRRATSASTTISTAWTTVGQSRAASETRLWASLSAPLKSMDMDSTNAVMTR